MVATHNKNSRLHIGMFALQVVQLGLLLTVAHFFLIEQTYGFDRLIPIIVVGFLVHALLPVRWRGWFFLLLFPVASITLLGPVAGAVLVVLGIFLFLLCHLPIPLTARAVILILVGIGLAAVRAGAAEATGVRALMYVQTQTLPILSAIFMFRTAIYLYDLRHEKGPVPLSERLGYFFLFPNIFFPLFPVIDYQTFKRTYFDRAQLEIYQKGIDWILRGIIHLLLYRIVYHYFVPDPLQIDDLAGVGQYVLSSFLLYLRVSGLFHLVIGILCLFGYNLPETHHRYYLAESFTDFWRRINIYWKDFMMKLFYFPIFMSLRRWGVTRAMIVATLATFFITWLLHSYQWFWLRGTFTLNPQDMIFWGVLAVLVTANSLYEEKYGRKRQVRTKHEKPTLHFALARSAKTVLVFAIICVLWSFWTSSSIDQWLAVMSIAGTATAVDVAVVLLLFFLAVSVGVIVQLIGSPDSAIRKPAGISIPYRAARVGGAAALLLVVAYPGMSNRFDPRAPSIVATISGDQLNSRDQQQLIRGYYEELLGVESSGSMVWSVRSEEPDTWRWNDHERSMFQEETHDMRDTVMRPHINAVHKGQIFTTNAWGMRDQEYQRAKPEGTYRIALLGSSHTLGAGILMENTFPSILERQLNAGRMDFSRPRIELLNFALAADSILRRLARFQQDALDFEIDMVVDIAMSGEEQLVVSNLREAIKDRNPGLDAALLDIVNRAAVTPEMSKEAIDSRLGPFADEILLLAFQKLSHAAKQNAIEALVFVLPRVDDSDAIFDKEWQHLSKLLNEAGLTAINLGGVYGSLNDRNRLKLASWDWHPNTEAHALVAERIYHEIRNLDQFATRINADRSLPGSAGRTSNKAGNYDGR